jgi:DNA-binding transcriptional MerR regulator
MEMETEKVYYSISEVAKRFGVNVSTLRYWEEKFEALHPVRNRRGVRFYSQKDIDLIDKIAYLTKQKGYSLEGVKKELKNNKPEENNNEVLQTLLETKQFLLELRQQLG